jgi:hypothetical protein
MQARGLTMNMSRSRRHQFIEPRGERTVIASRWHQLDARYVAAPGAVLSILIDRLTCVCLIVVGMLRFVTSVSAVSAVNYRVSQPWDFSSPSAVDRLLLYQPLSPGVPVMLTEIIGGTPLALGASSIDRRRKDKPAESRSLRPATWGFRRNPLAAVLLPSDASAGPEDQSAAETGSGRWLKRLP